MCIPVTKWSIMVVPSHHYFGTPVLRQICLIHGFNLSENQNRLLVFPISDKPFCLHVRLYYTLYYCVYIYIQYMIPVHPFIHNSHLPGDQEYPSISPSHIHDPMISFRSSGSARVSARGATSLDPLQPMLTVTTGDRVTGAALHGR